MYNFVLNQENAQVKKKKRQMANKISRVIWLKTNIYFSQKNKELFLLHHERLVNQDTKYYVYCSNMYILKLKLVLVSSQI